MKGLINFIISFLSWQQQISGSQGRGMERVLEATCKDSPKDEPGGKTEK